MSACSVVGKIWTVFSFRLLSGLEVIWTVGSCLRGHGLKTLSLSLLPWPPPGPLRSYLRLSTLQGGPGKGKAKAEHEARTRPPSFVISHSTGPYRPWRTAKPKSRNPNQTQRRQRPSAVVARSRPVAPGPPEGRRPSRAAGGSAPTRIRASRRTLRGLLSGLVAGNRGARPPPPPPPPW